MRRRATPLPAWCRIVREPLATYEVDLFRDPQPVRMPREVYGLVRPRLEREEVETFIVLMLNAQHKVMAFQEVTRGILNSSLVHPREVFRLAIAFGAAAIIVAHNHPSGDPTPSPDDRLVTDQLAAAGRILDMPLHDHLIIGRDRYVSFTEAGLL